MASDAEREKLVEAYRDALHLVYTDAPIEQCDRAVEAARAAVLARMQHPTTRPAIEAALDALQRAMTEWGSDLRPGNRYDPVLAARQAVLDAHEAALGVAHKVMRVNGHESSVDPTGRPYIKSMLVITSDLSVDQGREFRITDGDLVRVSKVEPDKSVEGT